MPGGKWDVGVDKTRAGLYINFKAKALATISSGERGVVVLPLILNWGTPAKFLEISEQSDTMKYLGYDYNAPEMLSVREAKKNAKTVLAYRLNGVTTAVAAAVTWTVSTVSNTATAKLKGTRGNNLKVIVATDAIETTKKRVQTLLDDKIVDEQLCLLTSSFVANDWIATITSTGGTAGQWADTAGATLINGTNGTVANQDWTDFLSATETQHFETIAYPTTDATLKASFIAFITRMRDEEGKKVVGVIANGTGPNFEGIINVTNGVVLDDGVTLDAYGAVPWVAGTSAGSAITDSNTYRVYQNAVDANPRKKNSEIVAALKAGEFIFIHDGKRVKVEKDINSLTTYTADKDAKFSKNRVIRTLDAINNDLVAVFSESYIGKIDNNADGQSLLKDAVNTYLQDLEDAGAIQNFDPKTDFTINAVTSVGDKVFATIGVQPVDSMEKFYFTVEVR